MLLTRHVQQRAQEPEFYSNLRQHTDLCTEVAKNARASLLLTALNTVASQTHACGTASCMDFVFTVFSRCVHAVGAHSLIVELLKTS